jgi:DNA adenine methylase
VGRGLSELERSVLHQAARSVRQADLLKGVKGKVMLSGYPSKLYDDALKSWTPHARSVANHAAGGATKRRRTEVLWCNF